MRMDKFNGALNNLDSELIDEFVREKEAVEQRKLRKRKFARYATLAASFVFGFVLAVSIIVITSANQSLIDSLNSAKGEQASIEEIQKAMDALENLLDNLNGELSESAAALESTTKLLKALEDLGVNMENLGASSKSELEREGLFVFEYEGKLYQAYVAPVTEDTMDMIENGSVSIQSVGDRISTVRVFDGKGNVAPVEIYSSKGDSNDDSVLLKLNSGYFLAKGLN